MNMRVNGNQGLRLPNSYSQPIATGSFLDSGTSSDMSSYLNFGDSNNGGTGIRSGPVENYLPSVAAPAGGGGMGWLFGDATQTGQMGNILGGIGAAGKMYMGMQQYGLSKDALAQSKEQYAKNYAAQQSMTNASLSDRQIARNAAGPGYQDTAGYMAEYGIK